VESSWLNDTFITVYLFTTSHRGTLHNVLSCRPRQSDWETVHRSVLTSLHSDPVYTIQPIVKPVEQQVVCLHDVNGWMLGCMNQTSWIHTTGWTTAWTGWMFVYMIQPVVQPVVKSLSNRFDNQLDNRLHRVNGVSASFMYWIRQSLQRIHYSCTCRHTRWFCIFTKLYY